MNEIMSYTDPEILTYRPRIYGRRETQYWELRTRLGYRVTADLYTTEEVLYRERSINEWRKMHCQQVNCDIGHIWVLTSAST